MRSALLRISTRTNWAPHCMRGCITSIAANFLAELGRIQEAETSLRRHIAILGEPSGEIARPHDQRRLAIAFSALGELMLKAARLDEARECFHTSIHHCSERSSDYRGISDSYLMRREAPSEALRWARLAIARAQADPFPKPTPKMRRGVTLWINEAEAIERSGNIQTRPLVQHHAGRAYV